MLKCLPSLRLVGKGASALLLLGGSLQGAHAEYTPFQEAAGLTPEELFGNIEFNKSENTTYKEAMKGDIGGGGFSLRITQGGSINPVGFQPPGIDAGCGGLDFTMGSLQFMDKKELRQLAREIPQMAAGYAIQLGLQAMCPTCSEMIAKIKDRIQKYSQMLGNACRLAQKAVDSATGLDEAAEEARKEGDGYVMDKADTDMVAGWFDWSSGEKQPEGGSSNPDDKESLKENFGNLTWNAMIHDTGPVSGPFGDLQNPDTYREFLMSLLGVYQIMHHDDLGIGEGNLEKTQAISFKPSIDYSDIIEGAPGEKGKLPILTCDGLPMRYSEGGTGSGLACVMENREEQLKKVEMDFIPLRGLVKKALLDPNDGIITRLWKNKTIGAQGSFTAVQKHLLDTRVGGMIANLVRNRGPEATRGLAQGYVGLVADQIAWAMIKDGLEVLEKVMEQHPSSAALTSLIMEIRGTDGRLRELRQQRRQWRLNNLGQNTMQQFMYEYDLLMRVGQRN